MMDSSRLNGVSTCHDTMDHGWTRLESSGILGIERGIALSAWMAFD